MSAPIRWNGELRSTLSLGEDNRAVAPAIVKTIATRGEGVEELVQAVETFQERATDLGLREERRREAAGTRFLGLLRERVVREMFESVLSPDAFGQLADAIARREQDPYTALDNVMQFFQPPGTR